MRGAGSVRAKEWCPRCWVRLIIVQRFPMGRARRDEPRTATLSPSPALRLSLILHVLADRAHAHRAHIIAEEAAAALDAPLPANYPDHTGRIVVNVQHPFAPLAPIIGPRQRLHEPLHVGLRALGRRSLGYSADGSGFAVTPLAGVRLALCR